MNFFQELEHLLGIAAKALPIIAAANTAANPAASNNAVNNATSLINLVKPLVDAGEAASTSSTPLTGAQKLANAQQALTVGIQLGTAAGIITQPEAAMLPLVTAAINTAVALKNAASSTPPTSGN